MSQYVEFTFKHRRFLHIADGWCARDVELRNGDTVWRLFYGTLQVGSERPAYVSAHTEADEYVQFPSFEECVGWVAARKAARGAKP